mmetsp:Transcript_7407/g.10896  ORF Transcript_7407/g.10896 Transcript_7407/m.10896 type:complete len:97 (+) Transcript_7407:355-645(+)
MFIADIEMSRTLFCNFYEANSLQKCEHLGNVIASFSRNADIPDSSSKYFSRLEAKITQQCAIVFQPFVFSQCFYSCKINISPTPYFFLGASGTFFS